MLKAERDFLDALPAAPDPAGFARSTFNSLEKTKLRDVLYVEQGALCVYCERRVAEGQPTPRIDHWRPLGQNPELALAWRNLYLCCAHPATCDCRKHETPLRASDEDPDLPWPVDHHYAHCVGFTSLGEMYVRSDAPLDATQREALELAIGVPHDKVPEDNGILNLNHPALVAARAAVIDEERTRLERRFKKTVSRSEREAIAAERLGNYPLPEFVSIRVRWLRKTLGTGR
ncbi:hypothetical protein [uncultured Thiodictyon sp.]|uniref:hypothetical protein n=1 Tax=uncultured Thiodictyon sp. TaxID=1846217 RepID=UPI0025DF40EC|nr:hypothetical protein [uncultured Thiodictyon sp.]